MEHDHSPHRGCEDLSGLKSATGPAECEIVNEEPYDPGEEGESPGE